MNLRIQLDTTNINWDLVVEILQKAGMGYQDILNYFYQDITVETIGEMEGKETL